MSNRDKIKSLRDRLGIDKIKLTEDFKDWVEVDLNPQDMAQAEKEARYQETYSREQGFKNNSIDQDFEEGVKRSIRAKQFEYALKQYGGGTARVVKVNEFHDYPDVGSCNARFTFDHQDSLMIMKKDQGQVPLIFGTGKNSTSSIFYIMGWVIPDYARQFIYTMNVAREVPNVGILNNMQPHECCAFSRQWLYPIKILNPELLK